MQRPAKDSEVKTNELPQARENACNLVAIGLSFVLDWVKEWRELSRPITDHNKLKPNKPFWIHFDPELTFFFLNVSHLVCFHRSSVITRTLFRPVVISFLDVSFTLAPLGIMASSWTRLN